MYGLVFGGLVLLTLVFYRLVVCADCPHMWSDNNNARADVGSDHGTTMGLPLGLRFGPDYNSIRRNILD